MDMNYHFYNLKADGGTIVPQQTQPGQVPITQRGRRVTRGHPRTRVSRNGQGNGNQKRTWLNQSSWRQRTIRLFSGPQTQENKKRRKPHRTVSTQTCQKRHHRPWPHRVDQRKSRKLNQYVRRNEALDSLPRRRSQKIMPTGVNRTQTIHLDRTG